jgi:hypothetical protein
MSELALMERLSHFELHQIELGDKYGAEVLHRTQETLRRYEAVVEAGLEWKRSYEQVVADLEKENGAWSEKEFDRMSDELEKATDALLAALEDSDAGDTKEDGDG